ncbi:MAG TPA: hypothetical protein VKE53_10660, partial [Pseudolabrys sp.]|nr:hypothetical protein [Pseudolabrys sp.]
RHVPINPHAITDFRPLPQRSHQALRLTIPLSVGKATEGEAGRKREEDAISSPLGFPLSRE